MGDRPVETVIQDDALMLHGSEERVRDAAREMRSLGVDRVRITASWFVVAPDRESTRAPAVRRRRPARVPGVALGAPGPGRQGGRVGRHEADARRGLLRPALGGRAGRAGRRPPLAPLRAGVRPVLGGAGPALQRRLRGPGREGQRSCPPVRLWTTWNEPNHASFLLPQWERKPGPRAPLEARLAAHLPADARGRLRRDQEGERPQPGAAWRHLLLRQHQAGAAPERRPAALPARAGLRRPALPPASAARSAAATARSGPTATPITPTRAFHGPSTPDPEPGQRAARRSPPARAGRSPSSSAADASPSRSRST